MFEKLNAIELTSEEIELCRQVYATASSCEDGARKLIEANCENGEETYAQIERGVDEFFALMAEEMVSEDQIRQKLTGAMENMSPAEQLRYLINVLVAMSYTGSKLHGSDAWTACIEEYKTVLEAVENGEADEMLEPLTETIPELIDLVCAHIDDTAVLFIGQPQYEALMKACETSDADEVQMIAANTRQASIAAAATAWTLYAGGKLPSLEQETDEEKTAYTPYMMGVITACTLEMDAAMKSGVWEKIKPILIKAARAAVRLAFTALALYGAVLISGEAAAWMFKLSKMAKLSKIFGVFVGIIGVITTLEEGPAIGNMLFNVGAKVVTVSVSAIREGYYRMKDWIVNCVIPAAWALWNKCSEFVKTRVLEPIAGKLSHAQGTAENEEHMTGPVNEDETEAAVRVGVEQPVVLA